MGLPKGWKLNKKLFPSPSYLLVDGEWVGVGGDVELKAIPPHLPFTIKEATADQYRKLAERAPKFFEKIKQDKDAV